MEDQLALQPGADQGSEGGGAQSEERGEGVGIQGGPKAMKDGVAKKGEEGDDGVAGGDEPVEATGAQVFGVVDDGGGVEEDLEENVTEMLGILEVDIGKAGEGSQGPYEDKEER